MLPVTSPAPSEAPAQQVGDAFVTSDQQAETWTIGSGQIHLTFGFTAAQGFVLQQIMSPPTGHVLTTPNASDSTVTINGTAGPLGAGSAGWVLQAVATSVVNGGVQLAFTFHASAAIPLTVIRTYACYPDSPVVETWTTFQVTGSGGTVTISNPSAWQLTAPGATVHYVSGLLGDNADAENDNAFTLQTSTLNVGAQLTLSAQGRSTEQAIPVVMIDSGSDEFFGGLLWSGSWQISVQGLASGLSVSAGSPGMDITVDAANPLEQLHGFYGVTAGGSSAVAQALHAFITHGLRQGRPFQPLVTYNTWFAYGAEIDEPSMQGEMSAAAALGVELFVVDAGWYTGAGTNGPFDFTTGLGSFVADPTRFPSGLPALAGYAHSLGMKFGLWVEPERTTLANVGQPGLAQEAWLATNNGLYDPSVPPNQQVAALICLGDAAGRQWLLDQLTTLLDAVQPDYLKWDNNFWINCTRDGHGHGPTDGNRAHVQGLYTILSALRARYPNMLIENVSGGGNRLDPGMLRYTDTAWMDDRTTPALHVRHNLEGLTEIFPPGYLLSFEVDNADEPLEGSPDLELYTRSRMPGIFGLSYRAGSLSDGDQAALAQAIQVYQGLRDTVAAGDATLLTPQALAVNGPGWDGLEELSSVSGNAIIFAFQNDPDSPNVAVFPTGLQAAEEYVVTTADGVALGSDTGGDLMTGGIEIDSSPASAAHVLLLTQGVFATSAAKRERAVPTSPRIEGPPGRVPRR